MSVSPPELAAEPVLPVLHAVGTCPGLVLLPVPVSSPPYDDTAAAERPRPVLFSRAPDPVGPLRALAPLRLVPPLVERLSPAPVVDLPPVRPVAQALVQALLEVLAGVRPLTQLRRRTTPELYERLEALVQAGPRQSGARPGGGAVRSVHVQEPAAGVAEVCATVRRGARVAAVALRLEHTDGAWCCTSVDVLSP